MILLFFTGSLLLFDAHASFALNSLQKMELTKAQTSGYFDFGLLAFNCKIIFNIWTYLLFLYFYVLALESCFTDTSSSVKHDVAFLYGPVEISPSPWSFSHFSRIISAVAYRSLFWMIPSSCVGSIFAVLSTYFGVPLLPMGPFFFNFFLIWNLSYMSTTILMNAFLDWLAYYDRDPQVGRKFLFLQFGIIFFMYLLFCLAVSFDFLVPIY